MLQLFVFGANSSNDLGENVYLYQDACAVQKKRVSQRDKERDSTTDEK